MNETKRRGRPPKAKLLEPVYEAAPTGVFIPLPGADDARPEPTERHEWVVAANVSPSEQIGAMRGRPPNALKQAVDDANAKNAEIASAQAAALGYQYGHIRTSLHDIAQAYAIRVWNGQSESLSRHERIGRVKAALEAQGMSMEGVEL